MKAFKAVLASLLVLGISSFLSITASAQLINKKSLLKDLNDSEGMTLSPKQKKDYEEINARTANSLLDMDKKKLSKDDRDKEVDRIFDRRDKEIEGIFGIGDKVEDTRKAYRRKTRGLRLKIKAAKLVL